MISPLLPVPKSPRLLVSRLFVVPLGEFSTVDTTGGTAELSVVVKAGDTVKAGSVLAKISSASEVNTLSRISSLENRKPSLQSRQEIAIARLRSSIRSAKEKLEKAAQNYTVKLDLYNKSFASEAELKNAEREKSVAESSLDKLNQILQSTDNRYQEEFRNIRKSIRELRSNLAAGQTKRLITSPVNGIVVELRSTPKRLDKSSYSIMLRLLDASTVQDR